MYVYIYIYMCVYSRTAIVIVYICIYIIDIILVNMIISCIAQRLLTNACDTSVSSGISVFEICNIYIYTSIWDPWSKSHGLKTLSRLYFLLSLRVWLVHESIPRSPWTRSKSLRLWSCDRKASLSKDLSWIPCCFTSSPAMSDVQLLCNIDMIHWFTSGTRSIKTVYLKSVQPSE